MDIRFSRHARRQMKWREIREEEVREALLSSEKVEDSIKNRRNALKHLGSKCLKVTFQQKNDRIVVITVIDKNR